MLVKRPPSAKNPKDIDGNELIRGINSEHESIIRAQPGASPHGVIDAELMTDDTLVSGASWKDLRNNAMQKEYLT